MCKAQKGCHKRIHLKVMRSQDVEVEKTKEKATATKEKDDDKMLKTTGKNSKAEDAKDDVHEASKEDPKKQKTTGSKTSTKASIAAGTGTPVPDEDDDKDDIFLSPDNFPGSKKKRYQNSV